MGKKQFIDRKSAKHFHVVHRSQRDPLINDDEASERVLKEVIPANLQKHKTQQEIDAIKHNPVRLTQDEIDSRVTLATQQGIYFEDVGEYDYSQHLRLIGSTTEAVFLEAPKREEKKKPSGDLQFKDDDNNKKELNLPSDVLPSQIERDVGAMNQLTGLEGGLQPDMDPRLREILEALEDEEYVEEEANDDFFAELNAEGAAYEPEEEEEDEYEEEVEDGNYNWEAAFRNFQRGKQQRRGSSDDSDDDFLERQTEGTSFSVSSSVMHRNAQLTLLDDRFEKIEEEYMREDEDEDENEIALEDRADFENILDDFLEKYEIVGRKMAHKLDGETGGEKLDTIRQSLGEVRLNDIEEEEKPKLRKQDIENLDLWERPKKHRETWDCQSVLSTYSNLENHPAVISDRGLHKKIVIDPKTGMPTLVEKPRKPRVEQEAQAEENDEDGDDDVDDDEEEEEEERANLGVARSKGESKEEKKARKAAVKEAKKNRREVKKSTKKAFKDEENRQRMTMQQQRKAKGVTHIA